jgi:hypothetical protein
VLAFVRVVAGAAGPFSESVTPTFRAREPEKRWWNLDGCVKDEQRQVCNFCAVQAGFRGAGTMSFLTDAELASLRIKKMILHVVGGKEAFQPQPAIEGVEHIDFFLARIQDAAVSGVHRFEEKSGTKELLQQIAVGTMTFEEGAQELSRRFSNDHVGTSRNGAFFVFELETDDPNVTFFSLIKYDYAEANSRCRLRACTPLEVESIKEPRCTQIIA